MAAACSIQGACNSTNYNNRKYEKAEERNTKTFNAYKGSKQRYCNSTTCKKTEETDAKTLKAYRIQCEESKVVKASKKKKRQPKSVKADVQKKEEVKNPPKTTEVILRNLRKGKVSESNEVPPPLPVDDVPPLSPPRVEQVPLPVDQKN
ncbi:hypothetical protein CASFOL_028523 [Castilleja foliolosa]|uniref:Uncharacterized protein n=1 Tax=Castilleja foliolosa TaxID=1961234 RepID=A0ABD3CEF1_9LAMI